MFFKPTREYKNIRNIEVKTYDGMPALITDPEKYTVLLLIHHGHLKINFEDYKAEGEHILFLCPNEIAQIPSYKKLNTIGFEKEKDLEKIDGFNYAFGNIRKFFKLKKNAYQSLNQEFKELANSQVTIKEDNKIFTDSFVRIFGISASCTQKMDYQDSKLVYNFISLVHEHFTMHHEMSYYAGLMGTSAKRITEKFKSLGIMSPHTFIKQRILVEVKRQLLYTGKTIKLISFDVGFNDPAYFSRFFKKNTGVSATQFMNKYNQ